MYLLIPVMVCFSCNVNIDRTRSSHGNFIIISSLVFGAFDLIIAISRSIYCCVSGLNRLDLYLTNIRPRFILVDVVFYLLILFFFIYNSLYSSFLRMLRILSLNIRCWLVLWQTGWSG